jgi:hypothetical protein
MIQARGVKLSLRVFSRLASIGKITDKRTSLVHLEHILLTEKVCGIGPVAAIERLWMSWKL